MFLAIKKKNQCSNTHLKWLAILTVALIFMTKSIAATAKLSFFFFFFFFFKLCDNIVSNQFLITADSLSIVSMLHYIWGCYVLSGKFFAFVDLLAPLQLHSEFVFFSSGLVEREGFMLFLCKWPHLGIQLGLLSPFPMTITVMPHAKHTIYIYIIEQSSGGIFLLGLDLQNGVSLFDANLCFSLNLSS